MRTVTILALGALFSARPALLLAQPESSNFDAIEQRIRANCYDCAGASETALRSAIADLDGLIVSGLTTLEARRLLADSYREIALTYSDQGSREQTELLARHQEIYRDLLAEYPENLDLLRGYARVADDVGVAQMFVTEATAALAEAHFISGALLVVQSRTENERAIARDHFQKAFDLATGVEKVTYGRRFADFLVSIEDNQLAERVLEEVETYRKAIGL